MSIKLHSPCLLVISGVSGSGKTTLLRSWVQQCNMPAGLVVSSDQCRQMLIDSPDAVHVNAETFELAHTIIRARARLLKPTVLDSTCLRADDLSTALQVARSCNMPAYHLFLDPKPEQIAEYRKTSTVQPHVFKRHDHQAKTLRRDFKRGHSDYQDRWRVESFEDGLALLKQIEFEPSVPTFLDKRVVFIGDVHSCATELAELLSKIKDKYPEHQIAYLGDLFDRGPDPVGTANLVLLGNGHIIPGNHDARIEKILLGGKAEEDWLKPEYADTEATIDALTRAGLLDAVRAKLGHISQAVYGSGKDIIIGVHAAVLPDEVGRYNRAIQRRAIFGILTDPNISEDKNRSNAPIRKDWQGNYVKGNGKFPVVCGHEVVARPEWRGNTINIDTGCVWGGSLTALVWPEQEIIQVKAKQVYRTGKEALVCQTDSEPVFHLPNPERALILDVPGGEPINISSQKYKGALGRTRLVAPWHLWFLAPTISPAPCDPEFPDLLEHPAHAVNLFAKREVYSLVAQTKHMGSRATTLVCRNADIAKQCFGEEKLIVTWSRNGFPFFDTASEVQAALYVELARGLDLALPNWDWVLLDGEMLPWTLKGAGLVTDYFLPTGAAQLAYRDYLAKHPPDFVFSEHDAYAKTVGAAAEYMHELQLYASPPKLGEWRYGIFNVLASQVDNVRSNGFFWPAIQTEGFVSKMHAVAPERFPKLNSFIFDSRKPDDMEKLLTLWQNSWGNSEGIVVKPALAQIGSVPAIKVRNPGYLRIIYGVDYRENLALFRQRSTSAKMSVSHKQYRLSLALLDALVQNKHWTEAHQLALGFIALNSEHLDPRL